MTADALAHEGRLDAILTFDPTRPVGFGSLPGAEVELLDATTFARVVSLADAVGYREVELIGADPEVADLDGFLGAAAGRDWRVRLATPGLLAPGEALDGIARRCRLAEVSVAVTAPDGEADDAARGAGAWDRAWATVDEAAGRGLPVVVEAIVLPETFDAQADLVALVRRARDARAAGVVFSRPVGPGAAGVQPSPEKTRWFRAVLDAYGLWDGYVSHRWHYKDLRPYGKGEEQMWDCERIVQRRLCVSPRGFHPCSFLTDVALAPLDAAAQHVASPRLRRELDWFRAAAIVAPGDPVAPGDAIQRAAREAEALDGVPPVFSCAECTECFVGLVRELQAWGSWLGPPGVEAVESAPSDAPR